jgi:hypothetical protein
MRITATALIIAICVPKVSAADAPTPITVPFELLKTKHMVVEIKVNGKGPYRVIFDTGAPVMLLNNKVAKASGLVEKGAKPSLFNPFGSMGQVKIKAFELGDLKAEDLATVVMDHPTVEIFSKFMGPIEGIVGFPFFARYKMTIDYQAKELTFVPNGYDPPDTLQAMMGKMMSVSSGKPRAKVLAPAAQWGLTLEEANADEDGIVVKSVLPGGAAERAGIKPADRICTIDGRWTDTVADAYVAASHVKPDTEAKLKIFRDNREIEVIVKPRPGL